jgi:excisionase family DNA binding protein
MDDTDDRSGGWVTVDDAADMLGVKPGTLRSWLRRGDGPPHYRLGGLIRLRGREVAAWRESQRVGAS